MITLAQLVERFESLKVSGNRQRYFFQVVKNYCIANGAADLEGVRPTARLMILAGLRDTVARTGHDLDSVIQQALDATLNKTRKRKGQPATVAEIAPAPGTQPLWTELYGDDTEVRWTSAAEVSEADRADFEVYLEQLELMAAPAQDRAVQGVCDWLTQHGWSVDSQGWAPELVSCVAQETDGDPTDVIDRLFEAAEADPGPEEAQKAEYRATLQEQIDELRAEVQSLREALFDLGK